LFASVHLVSPVVCSLWRPVKSGPLNKGSFLGMWKKADNSPRVHVQSKGRGELQLLYTTPSLQKIPEYSIWNPQTSKCGASKCRACPCNSSAHSE
jgi:hypothetical protein